MILAAMAASMLFAPADMILHNGKVWTGDARLPFVEAVAVSGERILATGSSEEMLKRRGPGTRVIDLQKRLVTPGFIDNHVHFTGGGFQLSSVQLRDAKSPGEFAKRIGEYARKLPPARWITGGEWDHELWDPVQLPTRQMIDALTPHHPVFVSRLDGHMALANSLALKLAGITRDSKDPAGGTIVRDEKGEPTGLLKDAAMDPVWAVVPPPPMPARIDAARAALAEAARLGVTAINDMSGGDGAFDDFRAYQKLRAEDALTTRIYLFVPLDSWKRLGQAGVEKGFGDLRLRIGGLKGFADGSLGSSTALFQDPYLDNPKSSGLRMPSLADGTMATNVRDAVAANLQVAIHAIGDKANDEVLKIYEADPERRIRRYRIEHAQHLNPGLEKRFAQHRVVASMQPYHAIDDGRWADRKIGAQRSAHTYAFRSLLDAGAMLTFGSDWGVAPLDPIQGIYAAVTRRTIDGKNPDGWVPEQKITVEEALRCYTANNAWAMFLENEIGRIRPGMLADLVVLSDDLFSIPPEAIERTRVEMTVLGGKIVYPLP